MTHAAQKRVRELMRAERLPDAFISTVDRFYRPIAETIALDRSRASQPLRVGICGAQGSGKSTMTAFLKLLLEEAGLGIAAFSIDDLYLTHAERRRLASEIHPLFATRGPPGTHDVALGASLIDSLRAGASARIPRFDKSIDDRLPEAEWNRFEGGADVILFEGWCVGARPQDEAALIEPINALERERDSQGIWRRAVNRHLATGYQALFARLDRLIMLRVPSFDCVAGWRRLQEQKLIERVGPEASGVMSPEAIAIFIQHYERVTRHILEEMPARADIRIDIDEAHALVGLDIRAWRSVAPDHAG